MKKGALGIIETYGYLGAVEASDAAVKSALVKILGVEKVKGGLVTITIIGDVAAVSSALSAAKSSVEKMGVMVTTHLIPRPSEELWSILPSIAHDKEEVNEIVPVEDKEVKLEVGVEDSETHHFSNGQTPLDFFSREELEKMRVIDLRKMAREYPTEIEKAEIKYAKKDQLVKALLDYFKKEGDMDG